MNICTYTDGYAVRKFPSDSQRLSDPSTQLTVQAESTLDIVNIERQPKAPEQYATFKSGWVAGVVMSVIVMVVVPLIPMLVAFIIGLFINRNNKG